MWRLAIASLANGEPHLRRARAAGSFPPLPDRCVRLGDQMVHPRTADAERLGDLVVGQAADVELQRSPPAVRHIGEQLECFAPRRGATGHAEGPRIPCRTRYSPSETNLRALDSARCSSHASRFNGRDQPGTPGTVALGLVLHELQPGEPAGVLDVGRRRVDAARDDPDELAVERLEELGLVALASAARAA